MSEIDVTFVCWPNHPARLGYAKHCFETVFERLTASRHQLIPRCSSESERDPNSQWMGDELQALCDSYRIPLIWRQDKADLGAAMNSAYALGTADYGMVIQDDFELRYPCDLSIGADIMRDHQEIDLIRYGWPPMTTLQCQPEHLHGFSSVDMDGMWPYGDEPSLHRGHFQAKWGKFLEYHHRHGQSETDLMYRLIRGKARIFTSDKTYFCHCGAISAVPKEKEYRQREIQR